VCDRGEFLNEVRCSFLASENNTADHKRFGTATFVLREMFWSILIFGEKNWLRSRPRINIVV